MRLSKQTGEHKVMMNITPLIDIVFLLIIFFVTVAQITEVNKEKQIDLPKLSGDNEQAPVSIIININVEGIILISDNERSIAETVAIVGNELAKVGNEPSMIRILIRHDRRATSGVYNELLRQFKQMDITQVRVGVEVEQ